MIFAFYLPARGPIEGKPSVTPEFRAKINAPIFNLMH
jgi:hypothetical protein